MTEQLLYFRDIVKVEVPDDYRPVIKGVVENGDILYTRSGKRIDAKPLIISKVNHNETVYAGEKCKVYRKKKERVKRA